MHGDKLIRSRFENGTLEVIDPASHHIVSRIPLRGDGDEAYSGQLVLSGGRLFVDAIFSKRLEVFDLSTMESVGFVPTTDASGTLCVSKDGNRLVHAGTGLTIIDPVTLQTRVIPHPPDQRGSAVCAFSQDAKTVHIGIQRPVPVLLSYDLDGDRWLAPLTLSSNTLAIPCAMVMSDDVTRLYVGLFQGRELVVVDLRGRVVLTRHPMPDPLALALTADSLYVVTREPTTQLSRLDPLSLASLRAVPLEGNAQGSVDLLVAGGDLIVDTHRVEDELTWLSLQSLR